MGRRTTASNNGGKILEVSKDRQYDAALFAYIPDHHVFHVSGSADGVCKYSKHSGISDQLLLDQAESACVLRVRVRLRHLLTQ